MRRLALLIAVAAIVHGSAGSALGDDIIGAPPGYYGGGICSPASSEPDLHSPNMSLVANLGACSFRQGSDLAFWGSTAVLGNYDNPGGFRLVDTSRPSHPTVIGQLKCPGPQNDVSIWGKLVFVSVDSPRQSPECGAGAASQDQVTAGTAWEGMRIVSIADPAHPQQIKAVYTDCGSHTHTLVPDTAHGRLLIYVQSYPLGGQGARCNLATHRKISVVEVPLTRPTAARVISTPSVEPAIGCHDTTVFLPRKLAASACISESQIWDISNPANPRILAHIYNPLINIHHSTTFSWDGRTVVIGDELAGAEASPGCPGGDSHQPLGSLWFYDISNASSPALKGVYKIPQSEVSTLCTAHNFNAVPLSTGRDVLVSAWYNGGTTVVDFTDPANPSQLGFYIAKHPAISDAWSSYWYNGYIYANNFDENLDTSEQSRGFDVMSISSPALRGAIKLGHLNPQTMEPLPR